MSVEMEAAVMNKDWKDEIELYWARANSAWRTSSVQPLHQYFTRSKIGQEFLGKIWEMSKNAFDHDREIQVVIDSNGKAFITFGTGGFVWFHDDNDVVGLKMPILCWIHTHPFGSAYFSGTDWNTINTYEPFMESAIVLGGDERMTWVKNEPCTHFEKFVAVNSQAHDQELWEEE